MSAAYERLCLIFFPANWLCPITRSVLGPRLHARSEGLTTSSATKAGYHVVQCKPHAHPISSRALPPIKNVTARGLQDLNSLPSTFCFRPHQDTNCFQPSVGDDKHGKRVFCFERLASPLHFFVDKKLWRNSDGTTNEMDRKCMDDVMA